MREVARRLSRLEGATQPTVRACDRDGLYARVLATAGGDDAAAAFAADVVDQVAVGGACLGQALARASIRHPGIADRTFDAPAA
ncbi:MAG TPA: hypothetical protein VGF55_10365 [Gemmataceae bacterium]|jgi:hypothetical protein